MAVKTIEMVRKIRDKHYEETKNLSVEEQIKFIREKAKKLQGALKAKQSLPIHDSVRESM
jgi:deoxyadenosine/deoxycytidine kinase